MGVTPEGGQSEITPVIKGLFIPRPWAPPTAAGDVLAVRRVSTNISTTPVWHSLLTFPFIRPNATANFLNVCITDILWSKKQKQYLTLNFIVVTLSCSWATFSLYSWRYMACVQVGRPRYPWQLRHTAGTPNIMYRKWWTAVSMLASTSWCELANAALSPSEYIMVRHYDCDVC